MLSIVSVVKKTWKKPWLARNYAFLFQMDLKTWIYIAGLEPHTNSSEVWRNMIETARLIRQRDMFQCVLNSATQQKLQIHLTTKSPRDQSI